MHAGKGLAQAASAVKPGVSRPCSKILTPFAAFSCSLSVGVDRRTVFYLKRGFCYAPVVTSSGPSQRLDIRLLRFRGAPSREAALELCQDLLEAQRHADAAEVAAMARDRFGPEFEVTVLEARSRVQLGQLKEAQELLIACSRLEPRSAEPLRMLGEVLLRRGDPGRAKKALERALARDSSDTRIQETLQRAVRLERVAAEASSATGTHRPHQLEPSTTATRPGDALWDEDEALTQVRAPSREAQSDRAQPREGQPREGQPRGSSPPKPVFQSTLRFGEAPAFGMHLPPRRTSQELEAPRSSQPASDFGARGTNSKPEGTRREGQDENQEEERSSEGVKEEPSSPAIRGGATASFGSVPKAVPPAIPRAPQSVSGMRDQLQLGSPKGASTLRFSGEDTSSRGVTPADDGHGRVAANPPQLPPSESLLPDASRPPLPEKHPAAASPGASPEAALHPAAASLHPEMALRLAQVDQSSEQEVWEEPSHAAQQTRARGPMVLAWLLTLATVGGVGYAFYHWRADRQVEFEKLLADAKAGIQSADYAELHAAAKRLKRARELQPADPRAVEQQTALGLTDYLLHGAFTLEQLKAVARRLEKVDPASPYVRVAEAAAYVRQGKTREMERACSEARRLQGERDDIQWLCASIEHLAGSPSAEAHLEEAWTTRPTVAAGLAYANFLLEEESAEEAERLLTQLVRKRPEHLSAHLLAEYARKEGQTHVPRAKMSPGDRLAVSVLDARRLASEGKLTEAKEALERVGEGDMKPPWWATRAAKQAMLVGKGDVALGAAAAAHARAPANIKLRRKLAQVQLYVGDPEQALQTLPEKDAQSWPLRLHALLQVRDAEAMRAAVKELDDLREQGVEPSAQLQALYGQALFYLGSIGDAGDVLQQLGKDKSLEVALLRAKLLQEKGRLAEAKQVLPADPPQGELASADILQLQGELAYELGDAPAAAQALKRALEQSPHNAGATVALLRLYVKQGEWDQALALGKTSFPSPESGASVGPRIAPAEKLPMALLLSEASLELGQTDAAMAQLSALPKELQENAEAKLMRVRILSRQGKAKEALDILSARDLAQYQSADALAHLAQVYLQAGQTRAARTHFDNALDKDAAHPDAVLGRAELDLRIRDAKAAIKRLDRALARVNAGIHRAMLISRLHTMQGLAYLMQGPSRHDLAERSLNAALEEERVFPEAHFWRGELLAKRDAAQAKVAYAAYLKMAPEGKFAERAKTALEQREPSQ